MSGRTNIKMKSTTVKKPNNKNVKSNQENIINNNNKYNPDNDTSVLAKPFATSVSGFSGVLKAFNNATTEVCYLFSFWHVLNNIEKKCVIYSPQNSCLFLLQ